jgi:serine/threonine protein kinase
LDVPFFSFLFFSFLFFSFLSSLSYHQNIIRLIGYTEAPNAIITPMYQGDLDSFIHLPQHKYTSLDAMDIIQHIVCGMEAIHSLGLAHRDVKPKNCLLEKRTVPDHRNDIPGEWSTLPYRIRLCDFGVCFVDSTNVATKQKFSNIFGVSLR